MSSIVYLVSTTLLLNVIWVSSWFLRYSFLTHAHHLALVSLLRIEVRILTIKQNWVFKSCIPDHLLCWWFWLTVRRLDWWHLIAFSLLIVGLIDTLRRLWVIFPSITWEGASAVDPIPLIGRRNSLENGNLGAAIEVISHLHC